MSRIILKDKADMKYKCYPIDHSRIMGSQDEIWVDPEVEVLSVKFSKVGKKSFECYPNLKWIVCRSHGSDNVRIDLAKQHNVGVVCTNPNTESVAQWINEKAKDQIVGKDVLLFGPGRIGKRARNILKRDSFPKINVWEVNSKTHENWILDKIPMCDRIIVACSPTETPVLNRAVLKNFTGYVVSIARPQCIDNDALLEAILYGGVKYAHMDMLDPYLRDDLIKTGQCSYYKHQSWNHDFKYNQSYFLNLSITIHSCLNQSNPNTWKPPDGLVLPRGQDTSLDKFFNWG